MKTSQLFSHDVGPFLTSIGYVTDMFNDLNFNAKFVLESMFLMLGPYGPSPLTINGRSEDLDHLSVNDCPRLNVLYACLLV